MTATCPFTIGDAAPGDAPALAAILGAWVRETEWLPVLHTPEEDEAFLTRLLRGHHVRVARDAAGRPIGFLARRHGDIAAFCIRRDWRGQGLGQALMAEVKAAEDRIAIWTFAANTQALSFYTAQGFVEVERTDGSGNEEGLPDVRMIWRKGP